MDRLTEEFRQQYESYLKTKCVGEQYEKDRGCGARAIILKEGGWWVTVPDPVEYWAINLRAAFLAFVGVFGLAMVLPTIIGWVRIIALRYWRWLRT